MSTPVSEEGLNVYMRSVLAAFALVLGALFAAPSWSQVQRGGGGGNAALMQQYQQLASERTQLQADNAKLKKDLDDLKKQLDATKQQVTASKAGAGRNQAALAAAQSAVQAEKESSARTIADYRSKMQELVDKFRETATQLQSVESERSQLRQQLAQSKVEFDKCAERNYDLYQVDREVLDRYEHQGAFSYLARGEPFTRIKRTQIDNFVLEYKERAEELRVKKPDSASAPPATPPGANGNPASAGKGTSSAGGGSSTSTPPSPTTAAPRTSGSTPSPLTAAPPTPSGAPDPKTAPPTTPGNDSSPHH